MQFTAVKDKSSKGDKKIANIRFDKGKDTRTVLLPDGSFEVTLGIGEKDTINRRKFITIVRKIIHTAKQHKIKRVAVNFDDLLFPQIKKIDVKEIASLLAQNMEMANFEFTKFKEKPKEGWNEVQEVIVYGVSEKVKNGLKKGQMVGEEVNKCRELSNTPGGDMTPKMLAEAAKKASDGTAIKISILGKKAMEKLKMGAILGVAKGSEEEPQFIIMEYWGAGRETNKITGKDRGARGVDKNNPIVLRNADKNNPIVLVGKGVTFDTGGLNLKPGDGMSEMHMDMSGGAAVIHTLAIAGKLKLKKNIIGLIPAVENMPSGSSYRPGDILRSMSGKTIEVLNTDAEGRVILADALTYAKRYKPRLVVDIATLTVAVLIALGQHASAILTRDEKIERKLREYGEEAGDYVWPLPLWDEYEEYIKGNLGDVSNIPASGNTRYAGVINSAMFLYQFAKDYPWVHIDMASRMTTIPSDFLSKGSSGDPVRLLTKLVEKY